MEISSDYLINCRQYKKMSYNGNLTDIIECERDYSNNKWHFKGGSPECHMNFSFFLNSDLIAIVSNVIFGRALLDFKIHFLSFTLNLKREGVRELQKLPKSFINYLNGPKVFQRILLCCINSHDFRRCFIKKPSHDFRSLQNL